MQLSLFFFLFLIVVRVSSSLSWIVYNGKVTSVRRRGEAKLVGLELSRCLEQRHSVLVLVKLLSLESQGCTFARRTKKKKKKKKEGGGEQPSELSFACSCGWIEAARDKQHLLSEPQAAESDRGSMHPGQVQVRVMGNEVEVRANQQHIGVCFPKANGHTHRHMDAQTYTQTHARTQSVYTDVPLSFCFGCVFWLGGDQQSLDRLCFCEAAQRVCLSPC